MDSTKNEDSAASPSLYLLFIMSQINKNLTIFALTQYKQQFYFCPALNFESPIFYVQNRRFHNYFNIVTQRQFRFL